MKGRLFSVPQFLNFETERYRLWFHISIGHSHNLNHFILMICDLILFLIGLLLIIAGSLGSVIESRIWWSYIKNDFPSSNNDLAKKLYIYILLTWVLTVVSIGYIMIFKCITCRTRKESLIRNILLLIYEIIRIVIFVFICLQISHSTKPKCSEIHEIGFYPGNESAGYRDWIAKKTKGMNQMETEQFMVNLPNMRCNKPHHLMFAFLITICVGWGVILLVAIISSILHCICGTRSDFIVVAGYV